MIRARRRRAVQRSRAPTHSPRSQKPVLELWAGSRSRRQMLFRSRGRRQQNPRPVARQTELSQPRQSSRHPQEPKLSLNLPPWRTPQFHRRLCWIWRRRWNWPVRLPRLPRLLRSIRLPSWPAISKTHFSERLRALCRAGPQTYLQIPGPRPERAARPLQIRKRPQLPHQHRHGKRRQERFRPSPRFRARLLQFNLLQLNLPSPRPNQARMREFGTSLFRPMPKRPMAKLRMRPTRQGKRMRSIRDSRPRRVGWINPPIRVRQIGDSAQIWRLRPRPQSPPVNCRLRPAIRRGTMAP